MAPSIAEIPRLAALARWRVQHLQILEVYDRMDTQGACARHFGLSRAGLNVILGKMQRSLGRPLLEDHPSGSRRLQVNALGSRIGDSVRSWRRQVEAEARQRRLARPAALFDRMRPLSISDLTLLDAFGEMRHLSDCAVRFGYTPSNLRARFDKIEEHLGAPLLAHDPANGCRRVLSSLGETLATTFAGWRREVESLV